VKKLFVLIPALVLAACNAEPAPVQEPAPTVAPEPVEPSLPAPTTETFAAALAEACPKAEKVNEALCKRAGIGSSDVHCKYSIGKDKYMRHKATLTPGDGAWTLADPETICASHGAK